MAPSIIGPDLKITGHTFSQGEIQVDGQVEGDLQCVALTVGETAQITGNIIAEQVVVRGKVMGSIRGVQVTLQSSSHVEGDVLHKSLAIEQGAYFEGKSRRVEDPVNDGKTVAAGPKPTQMPGANPLGAGGATGAQGGPGAPGPKADSSNGLGAPRPN